MALTRPRAHQFQGLDYKENVRVVATSNITLPNGAPAVVDGVSLTLSDRVLVTGQSTASENGIYKVLSVGTGANGHWIRSSDADGAGELTSGLSILVTEGVENGDTKWMLTTDGTITIGVTSLTFRRDSSYSFGEVDINGTRLIADKVNDLLTVSAGNNITLSANSSTDTYTISVSNAPTFTGNVTATMFIGNGSQLTNIVYANIAGTPDLSGYATTTYVNNQIANVSVDLTGYATETYVNTAVGVVASNSTFSSITKSGTDGTGDIGQSNNRFGTVYGLASSAKYADVAEKYTTDVEYEPGTVVVIGGNQEVTESTTEADTTVMGVISTDPAYMMNSDSTGQYIALLGRVPCKVVGPIKRGDLLITSNVPGHAKAYSNSFVPGSIIGKALEDFTGTNGVIEVVVGRF